MFTELPPEKIRFFFITAVIDYLKTAGYRIAAHTLTKTPAPLASRQDIAPLASLVREDSTLDIVGLNPSNSIFIARTMNFEEIVAHPYNDQNFFQSIYTILSSLPSNSKKIEFIFLTTGIILPDLILKAEWESLSGKSIQEIMNVIENIEFVESRIDPAKIAKFDDQKLYLRNIISRTKWLGHEYKEYQGFSCDICGREVWEGTYSLKYWENKLTVPYLLCPNDGAQFEFPNTSEKVSIFVAGFK